MEEGQKVMLPGHGLATLVKKNERTIGGKSTNFMTFTVDRTGMTIMMPENKLDEFGVRPTMDTQKASEILDIVGSETKSVDQTTWNRRYRDYMEKIKSGDPVQAAEVLRDLGALKRTKDLSFGERKMIDTVVDLLAGELSVALNKSVDDMEGPDQTVETVR